MWCDDFDADLYKVIPDAEPLIASVARVELFTHSYLTDGAINSPSAWNNDLGLIAFFGFRDPCKPASYYTAAPVARCTFEEAVRDLWVHGLVMLVEGHVVWDAGAEADRMMALMFHVRGDRELPPKTLARTRRVVLRGLAAAVERLNVLQQAADLS